MRESDLYKPVAQFFQREYGCVANETWIAGSGSDLAFPPGFGKRKPDVVACTSGTRREIHLAEGKLLNIPTHGFDETYNQLDSSKRTPITFGLSFLLTLGRLPQETTDDGFRSF